MLTFDILRDGETLKHILSTSPDLLPWQQNVVTIFWIICILGMTKHICHLSFILCQLKRVNLQIAIYCLQITFLQKLNLASSDIVTFPNATREEQRNQLSKILIKGKVFIPLSDEGFSLSLSLLPN